MKPFKIYLYTVVIATASFVLPSCKAKKLMVKSNPPAQMPDKPAAPAPAAPAPVQKPVPPPAPVKPDLNFSNVQFDFNSSVLRTDAIQYLDHISSQMKLDPSLKFILNGYASVEGTAKHNLALSIDRANAVKTYLVNSGIDVSNLSIKGYGATHFIASNRTEKGKELNRRVEVKLVK